MHAAGIRISAALILTYVTDKDWHLQGKISKLI